MNLKDKLKLKNERLKDRISILSSEFKEKDVFLRNDLISLLTFEIEENNKIFGEWEE